MTMTEERCGRDCLSVKVCLSVCLPTCVRVWVSGVCVPFVGVLVAGVPTANFIGHTRIFKATHFHLARYREKRQE